MSQKSNGLEKKIARRGIVGFLLGFMISSIIFSFPIMATTVGLYFPIPLRQPTPHILVGLIGIILSLWLGKISDEEEIDID